MYVSMYLLFGTKSDCEYCMFNFVDSIVQLHRCKKTDLNDGFSRMFELEI